MSDTLTAEEKAAQSAGKAAAKDAADDAIAFQEAVDKAVANAMAERDAAAEKAAKDAKGKADCTHCGAMLVARDNAGNIDLAASEALQAKHTLNASCPATPQSAYSEYPPAQFALPV